MNLKPGEIKSFEAKQNIPLLASGGRNAFLPAGAVAEAARPNDFLLLVNTPSGTYRMEEKYLAFCKEVK